MAKLTVITAPDPRLKIRAKPVAEITDEIRCIFDDMVETMYLDDGVGLAATQVGIDMRLIVIDTEWTCEEDRYPIRMANPEVLWFSTEMDEQKEGCLSVPEQHVPVVRPATVKIRYMDEFGKSHEMEADGLFARCVQHEIDHLNGILMVDHLSKLKQQIIMKKLMKLKRL